MTELPRFERLQVRVLIGTLKMLENQLRELPQGPNAPLHEITSAADLISSWRAHCETLHAITVDAPEPEPSRATTMEVA